MTMGTLSMVAEAVNGQLVGDNAEFAAVSTDTRKLVTGELFVALKGERYDAGEFITAAAEKGAAGAIVEQVTSAQLPQIGVENTRRALGDLARDWRGRFSLPVVGITGSNGKTTVKELTAAILRAECGDARAVLSTDGNFNNDVGLPLMVLRLRRSHDFAVFEMGASGPGEIGYLAGVAKPSVSVITNAAKAHLEGFGSLDGVATAKGEIYDELAPGGTAVINRDDVYFSTWRSRVADRPVMTFGMHADADYRAERLTALPAGRIGWQFELVSPRGSSVVELPLAGEHNIRNALAAAAVAMTAGAGLPAVRDGLAASAAVDGRLLPLTTLSGARLFDDSYNANPNSVAAAIDFLATQPGPRWLVLGDMAELGDDAPALHREVGERAREAGINRLICVGAMSARAAEAFGDGACVFANRDLLIAAGELAPPGDATVLVKGSRAAGLENVVNALTGAGEGS